MVRFSILLHKKGLPRHPYRSPIALDKHRHHFQATHEHVEHSHHQHPAGKGQFGQRQPGVSVRDDVISDPLPI